jgi:excinuclease ABC subunit A
VRGAVAPWKYFFDNYDRLPQLLASSGPARLLFAVIEAIGVDPTKPWKSLSAKQKDILLHGFRNGAEVPEPKGRGKKKVDFSEWTGVLGRILSRLEMTEDDEDYDELSRYLRQAPCPQCGGARLRKESLAVRLAGKNVAEVCRMDIGRALEFFRGLQLSGRDAIIAHQPLREISDRLQFLLNVGLHYLTLDRGAGSISGGEAQRIRLATQIGSRLRGVLYVLDEPSIGLHQRDNEKLIKSLCDMRDRGNTVIVVEHDEQTMRTADFLVDLGPGAGARGGELVASGKPADVAASKTSLTGRYLAGDFQIAVPKKRRKAGPAKLVIEGARLHNLKGVRLEVPCGLLVGITGVSGSGKSSLIMETMLPVLMNHCYLGSHWQAGPTAKVSGLENFDRCIQMDQSPIGRTPRSNPATYTKLFDPIRDLFATTVDAKMRGYEKGRFSFNVKGGRCEECGGAGSVKVAMNFLPDVYVECTACSGRRYNQETLRVKYRGRSIADVLDMTVDEGVAFFEAVPMVQRVLQTLQDVGLGYIHLGQSATTFSGGEAQRIKLARELAKKNTGKSMYILDEPTTGLHFADVQKLLDVANRLVDTGSTVVIIEHNLDVIKCCDWLIDMGPEGGDAGGEIVAAGTPEQVAKIPESATGKFLAESLKAAR